MAKKMIVSGYAFRYTALVPLKIWMSIVLKIAFAYSPLVRVLAAVCTPLCVQALQPVGSASVQTKRKGRPMQKRRTSAIGAPYCGVSDKTCEGERVKL